MKNSKHIQKTNDGSDDIFPWEACYAELLSPDEVLSQFHRYIGPEKESLRGKWLLNGVVSNRLFALLEKTNPVNIEGEFKAFTAITGANYGVIVSQIEDVQHRFLLPLYSRRVRKLFATSSLDELNLFFENETEEGIGLNYGCTVTNAQMAPVFGHLQSVDSARMGEYITGISGVIARLGKPLAIASLVDGNAVNAVSLSVVLPFEEIAEVLGFSPLEVTSS